MSIQLYVHCLRQARISHSLQPVRLLAPLTDLAGISHSHRSFYAQAFHDSVAVIERDVPLSPKAIEDSQQAAVSLVNAAPG
jgi:hypothetical protein